MTESSLSARPHGPKQPGQPGPSTPFPLVEQRRPSDRPAAVRGAKRRSEPLTARTNLESSATRERGFKSEGEGPLEEAPVGACADVRGATLLVELRPAPAYPSAPP